MDDAVEAATVPTGRTPAHLWIVGIVSLLWNAFGATDYTMTMTRNAAWLKSMSAAQMSGIDAFPAWATGLWALGAWGALAGSVLLLVRSRHAVTAFIVSLVGLAGSALYQFVVSPAPEEFHGTAMIVMNLVIWTVAIGLLLYARAMRTRGVLR